MASAGLSSSEVVEMSALCTMLSFPSINDQKHVSTLSDCPSGLSATLHGGVRFLLPPFPAVPLPLTGSVPTEMGGHRGFRVQPGR